MGAPLIACTITRLLIDLNRSLGHPRLYSEVTRAASAPVREEILRRYYLPYRQRVEAQIADMIGKGCRVVHISSHSFTPVLEGQNRNADVGLLYDPRRAPEVALCKRCRAALTSSAPQLRVRYNYPYTGRSDGFTSYLRRRFALDQYAGVELEFNQIHLLSNRSSWTRLRATIAHALCEALDGWDAAWDGLT